MALQLARQLQYWQIHNDCLLNKHLTRYTRFQQICNLFTIWWANLHKNYTWINKYWIFIYFFFTYIYFQTNRITWTPYISIGRLRFHYNTMAVDLVIYASDTVFLFKINFLNTRLSTKVRITYTFRSRVFIPLYR